MLKDFVASLQTVWAVQSGFFWEDPSKLCALIAVPG